MQFVCQFLHLLHQTKVFIVQQRNIDGQLLGLSHQLGDTKTDKICSHDHTEHRHHDQYHTDGTDIAVQQNGAPFVFVEGEDNHESFYDCFLKEIKDIPSLTSYVRLKTYGIKEGYLAVFTFPEPEASPEVKYGICVFNMEEAERQKHTPYEPYEHLPYYILAKIVDVWAIGEIKPHPRQPNDYVTTYYKTIDTPDLRKFVEWVMDKENLSPNEPNETYPDVVEEYLNGRL